MGIKVDWKEPDKQKADNSTLWQHVVCSFSEAKQLKPATINICGELPEIREDATEELCIQFSVKEAAPSEISIPFQQLNPSGNIFFKSL